MKWYKVLLFYVCFWQIFILEIPLLVKINTYFSKWKAVICSSVSSIKIFSLTEVGNSPVRSKVLVLVRY